jgi:hypothetical protein
MEDFLWPPVSIYYLLAGPHPRSPRCGLEDSPSRGPQALLSSLGRSSQLQDQHGVAVTIETVPLRHGFAIRLEHALAAGERGDQHQQ